jgi:hypothetical protein
MALAGCGESEERRTARERAAIERNLEMPAGEETPENPTRSAKCLLWPNNFRGACVFTPMGRGSFMITRDGGEPFYDEVNEIIVFVYTAGKADVRTKTASGESVRLGEAERSETYPACWIGEGFSVCAY